MKVLHVSRTDLVGGRFTGYYMHQALSDQVGSSMMSVWQKESDSSWVYSCFPPKPSFSWLMNGIVSRIDRGLALEGLTGIGGWRLSQQPEFKSADLVHLHLIHDSPWFSPLALPTIARQKPLVWTIHDCWAFTGSCIYPFECNKWMSGCGGKCPHPRSRSVLGQWTPAWHWQIKKHIYKNLDATLIVASDWVRQRVKASPLLGHLDCHLIPFGVDLQQFTPRDKSECKRRLGLDPEQHVIVFRAMRQKEDNYKGLRWIHEALKMYEPQRETCLLTLQDGQDFVEFYPKYRVLNLGWTDGEQLADALGAADVFLMPSIAEAFGLMAIEAMACGTPIIVFDGTSLPEIIHAPNGGGIVVPQKDSTALAGAINQLLGNESLRQKLGAQARAISEKYYSFDLYLSRHLNLYESVLNKEKQASL